MKKKFFGIAALLFAVLFVSSCDNGEDNIYNPFDEETKGEFYASSITAVKITSNILESENWTNIVKDASNRIAQYSYDYNYTTLSGDTKNEKRDSKIYYFKTHDKQDAITVQSHLEYNQQQGGIASKYSQKISDNIAINADGYISKISTTIAHYESDSVEPVIKTSEREFIYSGDICISSTFCDEESKITYTYDWNAYQLTGITVLKDNHVKGIIEYDKFDYTYNNDSVYIYSGTQLLPFVQRGLPEVFAAMGYFGKSTPYLLAEEKHSGYLKHNSSNTTTTSTETTNNYSLVGDVESGFTYNAQSNIYSTFYIDFKK